MVMSGVALLLHDHSSVVGYLSLMAVKNQHLRRPHARLHMSGPEQEHGLIAPGIGMKLDSDSVIVVLLLYLRDTLACTTENDEGLCSRHTITKDCQLHCSLPLVKPRSSNRPTPYSLGAFVCIRLPGVEIKWQRCHPYCQYSLAKTLQRQ